MNMNTPTNEKIIIVLENHGIEHITKNGIVFASDVTIGPENTVILEWVAMSGKSLKDILIWLGY